MVVRSRMWVCVLLGVLQLSQALAVTRKTRQPARDPLLVTPSEAFESHVSLEIAKAEAVLNGLQPERLFDSSYLVSAVYYRDGFLSGYPSGRADGDPSRRIIGHIARLLTAELRARYLAGVREYCERQEPETAGYRLVAPVVAPLPRPSRRTHPYAIDIFTPEGSTVRSASYGVVLLAEGGWAKDDPLSTSSRAGGNTVIVFDPEAGRLYRYCHLERVLVSAGDPVAAGRPIGIVGHTGLNASRRGHGGHLHFEINIFDGRSVRPLNFKELREFLRNPSAAERVTRTATAEKRAGVLP